MGLNRGYTDCAARMAFLTLEPRYLPLSPRVWSTSQSPMISSAAGENV